MSNYIAPSRQGTCTGCGSSVQISHTSAARVYCLKCRRAGLAPSETKHGTDRRYKSGCRCDECREGKAARMREYSQRRRAEGRPPSHTHAKNCQFCGSAFMGRRDRLFCGPECARDAQGRRPIPRFKVSARTRGEIHKRYGWVCQLCFQPTDPSAGIQTARYPTLDHIVPRSRGGSDEPHNLRTACRECNTKRGAPIEF